MSSKKISPVHIVAAIALGVPLGVANAAVRNPTLLSHEQMSPVHVCENGHDRLTEACLASGAKTKGQTGPNYAKDHQRSVPKRDA